ncbi:FK506-binding protein 2 [Seminavis robusta]|uniref:peptidylprolyl isomerase n=1 Tax=Seminavis robusta TaxID=568900 RepID=A0A9N8DQJ7_9STRA|nr:FK506-binding protein 2 [Seminavis robusta]|eukprot:Sro213_g088300.1 FK506-binding protein 2 (210) ;mRNA; f:8470-9099
MTSLVAVVGSRSAPLLAICLLFACLAQTNLALSPTQQTTRRVALAQTAIPLIGVLPTFAATAAAEEEYQDGPEGLKYVVTKTGTGPKPQRAQKIQTSYTLWINGFPDDPNNPIKSKQIDSSTKPILGDQPFKVRAGVSQVIRGWDLTLLDMQQGEARRLIVPPELGYGSKGVGPIPGGATLYFEMQLTKVEPLEELTDDAKKWLAEHPL